MYQVTTTSDELSASGQIASIEAQLHGMELMPPLTGLATLKIYDSESSSTSGKKVIAEATVGAGSNSIHLSFPAPRMASRGLYAVLTGTATYTVSYAL